jgi:uncharacterized membrane protein YebE (DUF533 family)
MNPFIFVAAVGYLGAVLAFGFAVYLAMVAPGSRASRMLIALLIVDGIAIATGTAAGVLLRQTFGIPGELIGAIHQASDWALVAIYLPFLGTALASKLVAPLRGRKVQGAILCIGAIVSIAILLLPRAATQPLILPFYAVISIVLTWGLVASIHSWFVARAPGVRAQARAFTLAFGVRDLLWATAFALPVLGAAGVTLPNIPGLLMIRALVYPGAVVLYVPLIVYGVLRTELFDIDLRLKKTLRRSLIAAAFVTAFFLVSELASVYLSDRFGAVIGLLGTGVLIFFLEPIQRAAGRISDAAMPNTVATPQYEAYRKLQVYGAAVQAALESGDISGTERRMLDSLVQSLGIDEPSARQLEADLRRG